jgi:hypothetical protein
MLAQRNYIELLAGAHDTAAYAAIVEACAPDRGPTNIIVESAIWIGSSSSHQAWCHNQPPSAGAHQCFILYDVILGRLKNATRHQDDVANEHMSSTSRSLIASCSGLPRRLAKLGACRKEKRRRWTAPQ